MTGVQTCALPIFVPADHKWFARLLISQVLVEYLEKLNPQYPAVTDEQKQALLRCRRQLEEEADGGRKTE